MTAIASRTSSRGGQITVGISDLKVSTDEAAVLVTHSLGSCIGVACHDPIRRISGLLHFQLPEARMDTDRAAAAPLMFADTGMERLFQQMAVHGADRRKLKVYLAGGAKMLAGGSFDIGRRNHAAARKILFQAGLFVEAEHCGGGVARTLYLRCSDGAVRLKAGGNVIAL
jgi:chemotaxis protein CheD